MLQLRLGHQCIAIVCAQSAVAHLEGNQTASLVVVASGQYYLGIGCFSATRSLKPPLQAYTSHLRRPLISFLVWLWLLDYCLIKINAVIHHLLHRWMTVII